MVTPAVGIGTYGSIAMDVAVVEGHRDADALRVRELLGACSAFRLMEV